MQRTGPQGRCPLWAGNGAENGMGAPGSSAAPLRCQGETNSPKICVVYVYSALRLLAMTIQPPFVVWMACCIAIQSLNTSKVFPGATHTHTHTPETWAAASSLQPPFSRRYSSPVPLSAVFASLVTCSNLENGCDWRSEKTRSWRMWQGTYT